uniref:NADH dehydrogenase subunit 2 n=1 Tax=Ochthephilus sericinus TaxID=3078930 RepID=UPI002A7F9C08|nr:NADH dehydrogenase subunit 2 [Ochthephilus sericinus]WON66004.1 NADH dehydrogenase subunit 2 [Ochthephilus sericinus]
MLFKFWKLIFSSSLIISMMITISSNSWLGMWLGLEINMLSIIPMMNNINNVYSTEASIKYFITQAMASSIILFSIIMMSSNLFPSKFLIMMLNSAILTKMGSAPFHFWFPEVMEGQPWMMCLVLLTVQKIAPFSMLNYNMNYPLYFNIIIILNMLISALIGLNQISLRKILTFSSINHMGWMITSLLLSKTIWIIYFITYSVISWNLIMIFKYFNMFFLKQIINLFNTSMMTKLIFMMNFLSLGGLPPFIGFMPKWLTIQIMLNNKMNIMPFLMVMLTLITLYYYLRVMFSTLMFSSNQYKITMTKPYNFWIMSINLISIIFLILSLTFLNL